MTEKSNAHTSPPWEIASKLLKLQGRTAKWLAEEVDISENTASKILSGKTPRSGYFPDIARVLGVPISSLYSESLENIFHNKADHTLDDAPECIAPYQLQLHDELHFLPINSTVWVVPANVESKEDGIFWLFRPTGGRRAVIRRAVREGDEFQLVTTHAALHFNQTTNAYNPTADGLVLGVLKDVASAAAEFSRIQPSA